MKKIAAILLFIFALTQAGSVLSTYLSDSSYVLVADEEKADMKNDKAIKEKKDFTSYNEVCFEYSHLSNTAFHLAEKIHLPPSLEELTPPPNFS